jgi:E3 ubiquitin-protein ligase NEDD4
LPPERTDSYGRSFCIDHSARRTHWEFPLLSSQRHSIGDFQRQQREDFIGDPDISDKDDDDDKVLIESTVSASITNSVTATNSVSTTNSAPASSAVDTSMQRQNTPDNPPDSPLPLGWEVRFPAHGRSFFIDHNTHTTTWVMSLSQSRVDSSLLFFICLCW